MQVSGIDKRQISSNLRPRPVPQPNLLLQVQTRWSEDGLSATLHYRLDNLAAPALPTDGIDYSVGPLPAGWIEQTRNLLGVILESGGLAKDTGFRLRSLGGYLYQCVLPPELQVSFRKLRGAYTLLIIADQGAALPWELLHDSRNFLGERFIIGRWPQELDDTRPYEFPIGQVSVAHYAGVAQPQVWADLLKPAGLDELQPDILTGGMLDLTWVETLRGLHLLRHGKPAGLSSQLDTPMPVAEAGGSDKIEEEVRTTKLSLRRNRPLVSLSYLSAGRAERTLLEEAWVPTYIRAGCSAFVGPLWAVHPAVEAAFINSFYTVLWSGAALGEAFQTARRMARTVMPDSLDWLAYVLFGDPMARAYRPVKGTGYAVVEPVGRQVDEPLPAGGEARFRVMLRRTPPVWHEDRVIEVAEEFHFYKLRVHVVTSDLQVTPPTVEMKRDPYGNYLGWFTATAPPDMAEHESTVQVYYVDDNKPVHSLMFPLKIVRAKERQP